MHHAPFTVFLSPTAQEVTEYKSKASMKMLPLRDNWFCFVCVTVPVSRLVIAGDMNLIPYSQIKGKPSSPVVQHFRSFPRKNVLEDFICMAFHNYFGKTCIIFCRAFHSFIGSASFFF